jgi:polyisoprenoid-binding protein YceI
MLNTNKKKMKKVVILSVVIVAAFLFSFKPDVSSTWTLDKNHAKLGFSVTHMAISEVEGWFKSFDAKITTSGEDFSNAVVEMTADVNSINTDNEMRDKHLKSPDFFDAVKFPTLSFKSTSFKKISETSYKVTGDLTMHGVTKPLTLDVICRTGKNPQTQKAVAGFRITGTLKRSDFVIGTSMASNMVGDEIILVSNAEFQQN